MERASTRRRTAAARRSRAIQRMALEGGALLAGSPVDAATRPASHVRAFTARFDTTRSSPPPLRVALGGDACDMIHGALKARLDALQSQERLARSMSFALVSLAHSRSVRSRCCGSLDQRALFRKYRRQSLWLLLPLVVPGVAVAQHWWTVRPR